MELLSQGLNLMLYGIGTVFTFLCLLIVAMSLMSAVLKAFPEPAAPVTSRKQINSDPTAAVDENILQAISLAIKEHRTKRQQRSA